MGNIILLIFKSFYAFFIDLNYWFYIIANTFMFHIFIVSNIFFLLCPLLPKTFKLYNHTVNHTAKCGYHTIKTLIVLLRRRIYIHESSFLLSLIRCRIALVCSTLAFMLSPLELLHSLWNPSVRSIYSIVGHLRVLGCSWLESTLSLFRWKWSFLQSWLDITAFCSNQLYLSLNMGTSNYLIQW